jgi:hypothetical protein
MRLAIIVVATALAIPAFVSEARADADSQCVQAHLDAQRLRREQKLVAARARMVQCAGSTCPALVRADCASWLDDASRSIPSVVVSARDEGGHELTDVSVSIPGRMPSRRIDGTPIELDPGAYRFRYERPGAQPIERDVLLQTGVRNRVIEVTFPGGRRAQQRPKPPVVAYVLAGVSAVAIGSFTYFGLKGRSEYLELEDRCDTSCTSDDTAPGRKHLLIADISLGVAALSLAGAGYFFFIYTPQTSEVGRGGFASVVTRF